MTRHVRFCTNILLAAAASWLSPQGHAVTTNWIATTGQFTDPANWDNGVPDGDDTAVFNRGAGVAYHVAFPGGFIFDPPLNYVIDSVRVHSNNVRFRDNRSEFITAPNLTLAHTGNSIVIGESAGELAILNTSLNSLAGWYTSIGRFAGSDGTLNVTAGTFSMSGNITVGESGTGRLNITGGTASNNFNGYVGYLAGSTGSATVSGLGSAWTSSRDLSVGHEGAGTLRIEAGGRVSNALANVGSAVGSTGTATVTGEDSTWFSSNDLSVGAAGTGTLMIENGGDVSSPNGYIGHLPGSNGTVTVSGIGSTWTNAFELYVGHTGAGTLTIQDGGAVSGASELYVGQFGTGTLTIQNGGALTSRFGRIGIQTGSSGTVTVSGLGSAWTINELLNVGAFGMGTLRIENGGSVSSEYGFVGARFASGLTATAMVTGVGSTWTSSHLEVGYGSRKGTLTIEDGGTVSNVNSYIATNPLSPGTVTVTGAGATWNTSGSMYVGGHELIAGDIGSLIVETGGIVNIGQDLVIWDLGTVNLHGGQINLASGNDLILRGGTVNLHGGQITLVSWEDLIFSGGSFDFGLGTLKFTTSQAIGFGDVFEKTLGGELRLHLGQHLEIDGAVSLNAPFQIDGGHLEADSLAVNSDLAFTAGVLEVRSGSITGVTSLVVPSSGELRTRGTHSFRVTGLAGSTITATGNLTLGDATRVNGFYTSGTLNVGPNVVTLRDANDVVFDSGALITLGAAANAGTLIAANGLTLDFGGNVTGFGTLNTPNNPVRPLINNGHIKGNSAAQRITLSGYVKGVGTLDNVLITGTDAPGFSAATVYRGSVTYNGLLEIEIGGTTVGSFDRIIHSGTAALGGTLQVALIDGFTPAVGNSFDILDWSSLNGVFDTLQFPALSAGLSWNTSQLYTTGVLSIASVTLPGDYNQNGTVDAADYVLWRKHLGSGTSLPNDDTPGVGPDDYARWRTNFGRTAASGATGSASAAVPEPACAALVCLAMAGLWMIVRSR